MTLGNTGRLIQSDDPKRKIPHGLPAVEQLAATLRDHLERAGVKRRSLYTSTNATKQITFYDLRAGTATKSASVAASQVSLELSPTKARQAPEGACVSRYCCCVPKGTQPILNRVLVGLAA